MSHTDTQQESCRSAACANPGNPVFTCARAPAHSSASAVQAPTPLYRTTASDYGSRAPTPACSPCTYRPLSRAFSEHLGACGMYRDNSFNTSLDRSRVYDCPNLQNTI
ncbi:piercer of microtubule wall 2 protein-like [Brachyhypopomus gauderio]|uniref:piercer of microtubule wall 2 protein-like n=1 Tax=Brachyhypopomus gauderio TaxID=698409 RepID=UPI004042A2F8